MQVERVHVKTAGQDGKAVFSLMANSFRLCAQYPAHSLRFKESWTCLPVSTISDTRHIITTLHKIQVYQVSFFTVGKGCDKCRVQICSDVKETYMTIFSTLNLQ